MPDPRTAEERLARAWFDGYKGGLQNEADDWNCPDDDLWKSAREYARLATPLHDALAVEPVPVPLERAVYCTGGCDACRDYARELGVPLIVPPIRQSPSIDVERLARVLEALWRSPNGHVDKYAADIAAEYARLATPPEPKGDDA